MAQLNGKGPENSGSGTGRSLGNCCKHPESKSIQNKMGQGMGKRRKAGIINQENNQK